MNIQSYQSRRNAVVLILSGLIITQPAIACSPAPDSKPASIAEKVRAAAYVFEGIATQVNPPQVTIQVSQYLKGTGPAEVTMTGFNEHSCSDFLSVDQQAIFFGEGDSNTMLSAVYDGAFGSIRLVSQENFAEIAASVDCMATYHDGFLSIPCVAAPGTRKIYSANLLWQKSSNPMLFSVKDVQASTGVNKPTAHVETIDIQSLESFPVQVHVIAKGYLSDGCKQIDQINTVQSGNMFTTTITTISVGEVCTQALVPFEEVIVLKVEGLNAGLYTVNVNGVSDTFELIVDNVAR